MLFHTERLRLISEIDNPKDTRFCIIGFPFDSTETNTPGQRFGPQSIRDKFLALESKDMTTKIFDAGDIVPVHGNAEKTLQKLTETIDDIFSDSNDIRPIILGGEHSGTLGSVKALKKIYPNLQVISFDAHYDLKDTVEDEKLSHATVMRRIHELKIPVTIVGARTGSEDEIRFSKKINTDLKKIDLKRPIYLSLDIDFFEPSCAPGVGDPETGGFFYENFRSVFELLSKADIVGADIMEVNPMIENNITPSLAARCLLDILEIMDKN
ncbi:MAG: agmatinase [Nanohaloarchaea archaeon]|nr:agmatinase [Candidatus Nanohaloarchaea archaeon]